MAGFKTLLSGWLLATAALVVAQDTSAAPSSADELNAQALDALRAAGLDTKRNAGCSLTTAHVRQNWAVMSPSQRKQYTKAVNCLLSKPSKADPSFAPGAKNRYDDFVAVHINQTRSIHGTGNFLSWHRYFVWAYETALRNECGYTGYQPYWDWFSYQGDPRNSPVFDGSDTSMSGDGSFVSHNGSVSGAGTIFIPSGKGGGCITSGPFVNMTVNLGPISPGMAGLKSIANGAVSLGWNPRCLSRDLSPYASTTWLQYSNLLNVTLGQASANILTFQNELQGRFGDKFLGMHAAGHYTVGGDASDLYSSVVDPTFWLHHAMVDRVWWMWQALHLNQASTIAGTITILNTPPSRNATVDDPINLGVNAPAVKIKDVLNTLGSTPLCYIYL